MYILLFFCKAFLQRYVLTHTVPEDQLWEYISLCGLRTHDELNGEHVC